MVHMHGTCINMQEDMSPAPKSLQPNGSTDAHSWYEMYKSNKSTDDRKKKTMIRGDLNDGIKTQHFL